ncbi:MULTISPECIES: GolD/DthD family dehydrogenase [unclassified Caballeronia]|uniref:SDR family oxidoreductase n=1 Tax=unclassified Caballeronia TaxID=2646786 RepID=UPI0028604692|nr:MULTISPECIES: D-threitol dehydrogenase [unclassified Caballeronia]MDR5752515.1 D-threitol dehydrogenase [Caballeronia sp. LZ024]MDR5841671.1 D-threitol dehydrogenase [Caballeronia sp. LZ031]
MPGFIQQTFDFSQKVVLITGGASGIGLAIATEFVAQGARVALVDASDEVERVAASLGNGSLGWQGDVSDEPRSEAIVAEVIARLGRIDVLVNNAGVGLIESAEAMSTTMWDTTMAVNLRGPFLYARAVGRHMLERRAGRIVNMASQAALVGLDKHAAYSASKAGLLGMTRVLAGEWGPRGVTVNAISPTIVETELGRRAWAGEVGDRFKRKIPSGRFARPEEIACAVLYLASDAAAMINGENLVIDGGYTTQ